MSYAYGMRGAPAVGGGLPGLPRRAAVSQSKINFDLPVVIDALGPIDDEFIIPDWVKAARIIVVGAGGNGSATGTYTTGGGGGGLSRTDIFEVKSPFTVRRLILANSYSQASFLDRSLRAYRGGNGSSSNGGLGGVATGGDFNYTGGDGAASAYSGRAGGGGGAAGFFGNYGEDGSGAGGLGQTGMRPSVNYRIGHPGGGGGVGGNGGPAIISSDATRSLGNPPPDPMGPFIHFHNSAGGMSNGGDWGGGGGGRPFNHNGLVGSAGVGGRGGIRIELWGDPND